MADVKLSDAVFAVDVPNHELLKIAYVKLAPRLRLVVMFAVVVKSHGAKRELVGLVSALAATLSGVVVV